MPDELVKCPGCNGSGRIVNNQVQAALGLAPKCQSCKGAGKVKKIVNKT